ncbi:hypothetical protein [Stenotrophomonas phage SMA7]|uniref:Uncharacterized protein n=1 Tax=Stenotrophomonas phage SMA7 TaxID=1343494 RepID=S0F3I5_9VIRU|nr:hypothetical protein [Stenotrophomonas phage SMA7]CDF66326.1 hypothetical protein [Stenotrophomonas phage SMA7]
MKGLHMLAVWSMRLARMLIRTLAPHSSRLSVIVTARPDSVLLARVALAVLVHHQSTDIRVSIRTQPTPRAHPARRKQAGRGLVPPGLTACAVTAARTVARSTHSRRQGASLRLPGARVRQTTTRPQPRPIRERVVETAGVTVVAMGVATAAVTAVGMGAVTAAGTVVEMGAAMAMGMGMGMGTAMGTGIAPILMAARAPDRALEQAKVVTAARRGRRQGASTRSQARRFRRSSRSSRRPLRALPSCRRSKASSVAVPAVAAAQPPRGTVGSTPESSTLARCVPAHCYNFSSTPGLCFLRAWASSR